jgi:glycosyltransferase involved in cell wall biosynthesis
MGRYRPDVLVEHDVTADLMAQVLARRPSLSAWWDWWRWRRFERAALRNARSVVVMSEKDRELAGLPAAVVIPNGVDLDRFTPAQECAAKRILFVGSFRHFPNVRAWRFFLEQVWPLLAGIDDLSVTVIAGPHPELYCDTSPIDPRIEIHGYVEDVRPHYERASVVVVPTLESAGTNLKALEAAAMGRAIVSTPSGVAGLGLVHGESAWIDSDATGFAGGVRRLLEDPQLRSRLAASARAHVERHYGWAALARLQVDLWRELAR